MSPPNSHSLRQLFQLPLSVSCVFILPAGRHAILRQCTNIYARTDHSNTKYNTTYNCFGSGSCRDIFCKFVKLNHGLTTQLTIIITGLLSPNFACNVQEYLKDGRPKLTCASQNALCGTHSDTYCMPKTVSQSMRIIQ